jgi:hypothetical protein
MVVEYISWTPGGQRCSNKACEVASVLRDDIALSTPLARNRPLLLIMRMAHPFTCVLYHR